MKWLLLILALQGFRYCFSQDVPEQQLEEELQSLSETNSDDLDDDDLVEQLDKLHKHPININRANQEELLQLPFVSPILIKNLILYRALLGNLIHINELQAVPGWNVELIRKIFPYITIDENDLSFTGLSKRFRTLRSSFLFRIAQGFSKGQDSPLTSDAFTGSPQHVLVRLQFHSDNLLQFGALVEKDAGEKWLSHGAFDFNSFYCFARNIGFIKCIALGDFQVNMGQGLIQWQGIARKKSGNTIFINQQDQLIKPYHSAGEIRFHRGAGIVLARNHFEWMIYGSSRRLSANLVTDSFQNLMVTSISNSGYHRTLSELMDRNQLHQLSAGSTLSYSTIKGRLSFNYAAFKFSHPIQKGDQPYNLFSFHGKNLHNMSIDYSYTLRNVHSFGELAIDKEFHRAFICGALLSLHRNLDCSLLFRSISPKYSSFYSNAFIENSSLVNETGWYTGISFRVSPTIRLDGYADVFYFPWLKYQVDAPSMGKEFFFQLNWQPNKRLQLQARCRIENKESDDDAPVGNTEQVSSSVKINWRSQMNWLATERFSLYERIETSSFKMRSNPADGFLLYNELHFHPPRKPFDCWARALFFQTDSYDARIYAFERDVQYAFSVPAYAGTGMHWALNFHYDVPKLLRTRLHLNKSIGLWMSLAHTITNGNSGAANAELLNKRQTIIRLQVTVSP